MSAQADVSLEYQRSRIGTRTLVLCEGYDGEQYVGRDYANAPDIDGKIYFSSYGSDLYGKLMLPELLRRLSSETQIPWFRLFYCYPDKITDELIFEIRDNPRVLHYIDIPIQHINDTVLKRMNRHGNRKLIEDLLSRLRTNIPDMVIRTTAIVGFPFAGAVCVI